jgi:5'-3' exoribonuclease 2
MKLGEAGFKDRYYAHKIPGGDDPAQRRAMVREYVRGLCWVAEYYTQGVPSWSWYYPFWYAPFASDLTGLHADLFPVTFDRGEPFRPLTQLMAVLPAASAHCVPACFASLMTDPKSPIADCYPTDFPLDPNGKPSALTWLWVARLPFLDAPRLVAALEERYRLLDAPRLVAALEERYHLLDAAERARDAFCDIEVIVSRHHPLTANNGLEAALAAGGNGGWIDPADATLSGRIRNPRPTLPDAYQGVGSVRFDYSLPPRAAHSSRLRPEHSAAATAEPIAWLTIKESVPKRTIKMPISDDELAAMLQGEAPPIAYKCRYFFRGELQVLT